MADTVADVLVRLGVDTAGLRSGFRDARNQTTQFAADLARTLSGQGGILGIIGGATRTIGGLIPGAAGGILRGIGSIFASIGRFFSGLFKRASRRAAQEIRQEFETIISAYRAGSTTLGATIQQLERERAEAIRRLSGKKGGRKELDKLLPDFDSAIADLRARQQAIFERFDEQLGLLRAGEAFRNIAADVRELIRQYREYVDAGGNLARANEFLSLSLERIRSDSAAALEEGEQRAIEDALQLNDLLREREELLAQAADDERNIRTRGVLERQQTLAQQKSVELEVVRRRRDERLAELDREIAIQQLKVDSEARVFDLTAERVALEARLLELKAREFDREAAQLAALRNIVAGIVPGANGLFSLTPALQAQLHLGNVQIFLGAGATSDQARAAGEEVVEGMLRALVRERDRLGLVN